MTYRKIPTFLHLGRLHVYLRRRLRGTTPLGGGDAHRQWQHLWWRLYWERPLP